MHCCNCCKKRKNSNPILVESIATITPSNQRNERLKELETVINEIISQLNSYYVFQNKTQDEALENIHSLVIFSSKKYDLIKQPENSQR